MGGEADEHRTRASGEATRAPLSPAGSPLSSAATGLSRADGRPGLGGISDAGSEAAVGPPARRSRQPRRAGPRAPRSGAGTPDAGDMAARLPTVPKKAVRWADDPGAAPRAPWGAQAGNRRGGSPALAGARGSLPAPGAPAGRSAGGRRTAGEGAAAWSPKGPPPPGEAPAPTGAPAGRRKGRRRTAGKGPTPGASKRPEAGPAHIAFPQNTVLRYKADARKSGASGDRFEAYRVARSAGKFFDLHPGSASTARNRPGLGPHQGALQHPRVRCPGQPQ